MLYMHRCSYISVHYIRGLTEVTSHHRPLLTITDPTVMTHHRRHGRGANYSVVDSLRLRIIKMSDGLTVLRGLNANVNPNPNPILLALSISLTLSISVTHPRQHGPLITVGGIGSGRW